ncbi:TonB family protein [uncultured Bradyrhizobium sp.]|uniref:energy transducer TonB family protein n=1 Tax=uncultured Bradyrhizobium sp. TaxID=199684 RepID=UPI0035CA83BE
MVRWSASAAIVVAAHAALIALGMAWYTHALPPGAALPSIMIDLAPSPSAPITQPLDLAPGPAMQQADTPPLPVAPTQEAVQEQLAPTLPQDKPIVEAQPEQNVRPVPLNPEPNITPDRPKVVPVKKPAPVRAERKKPADAPPAPRTSAAPKAERQAPSASPATAGVSAVTAAAALASYNQRVAAHLQRFKQYPPGGEQGTSRLSFTLGRGGQVLGSRIAGSSGHPTLDNETLAMIRRAQPFPPIPPELKQASMSFTVPVRFSVR